MNASKRTIDLATATIEVLTAEWHFYEAKNDRGLAEVLVAVRYDPYCQFRHWFIENAARAAARWMVLKTGGDWRVGGVDPRITDLGRKVFLYNEDVLMGLEVLGIPIENQSI